MTQYFIQNILHNTNIHMSTSIRRYTSNWKKDISRHFLSAWDLQIFFPCQLRLGQGPIAYTSSQPTITVRTRQVIWLGCRELLHNLCATNRLEHAVSSQNTDHVYLGFYPVSKILGRRSEFWFHGLIFKPLS